jgi:sigma-B regulation protein RsbU (phosphoserine phosphatase)
LSDPPDDAGLEREVEALAAELVDAQDQLLALYELARTVRGHLEPRALLNALVESAVRLIRADGGFASLALRGQPPLLVLSAGLPVARVAVTDIVSQSSSTGRAVQQRTSGGGRALIVPIPLHSDAWAVLGLVRDSPAGFGAPEQKLATAIADQASGQIDGVLLHQEVLRQTRFQLEYELARYVQAGLVADVPTGVPGLDVHAESRPASEVGGDFFDFTLPEGGGMVGMLGDVAGKGIQAALLVGMTRAAMRTAARSDPEASPSAVLRGANTDLYRDLSRLGLFATVSIARFEPGGRRLTLGNAGHSPVIHVPAGGRPCLVKAQAPPLGVVVGWDGTDTELSFGPDDLLVVATDGFSEAVAPRTGELFGYDRLLDLASRSVGRPAADVAAAFFRANEDFEFGAANGPADDRSLLVLRGVSGAAGP